MSKETERAAGPSNKKVAPKTEAVDKSKEEKDREKLKESTGKPSPFPKTQPPKSGMSETDKKEQFAKMMKQLKKDGQAEAEAALKA